MSKTTQQKAVIYCRVASYKHSEKGCALNSQENHCREYARLKGYDVANVFCDEGISGDKKDRSGMNALLTFLGEQEDKTIVIIEDIARLARNVIIHMQLRNEIINAGGKLESPTFVFGDDPQSKYLENISASVSQYKKKKTHNN